MLQTENTKSKSNLWQIFIENLTHEKNIKVEDSQDGNIQINSKDANQIRRICDFIQNLTKDSFDQTRVYRLTPVEESIKTSSALTIRNNNNPPKINDISIAKQIFCAAFDERVYATLDLKQIFATENKWEPDNISQFKEGKLISIAFESKYVYENWYLMLQNIYNAFNQKTREDAQAAIELKKPLSYQKNDLQGSIKTFLQECIFLYKFFDTKTSTERVQWIIDFKRLTEFLYPPMIEQTQESENYVATFNKAHFMAYVRQVSGGNLLEIFEADDEDNLSLRPILLSSEPSLPPPVKIIILADCSGSMKSSMHQLIQSLAKIQKGLKEKFPNATLEVIFFNDKIIKRFSYKSINAPSFTNDIQSIKASGETALHQSIQQILGEIFEAEKAEPSNTIVGILTDGEETVLAKEKIPEMQLSLQKQLSSFEENNCRRPQFFEFGLGEQFKINIFAKETLIKLAEKTDGKFYEISNLEQMFKELLSEDNVKKMKSVRQILELLIQYEEKEFFYEIPVVQTGEPQMPEIIIPIPRREKFKFKMAGIEFSASVDETKLEEPILPSLAIQSADNADEDELKENKKEKGKEKEEKEKEKELVENVDIKAETDVSLALNIEIKYEDLILGKELGRGGFGAVHQATYQGKEVAVKCLLNPTYSGNAIEQLKEEADMMFKIGQSKFIIQILGACLESPHYCIVMEYMPKGNLFNLLHSPGDISWPERIVYATDVAQGLKHLHSNNFLHRDLKSLNVLLTTDGHAKLCDFGLAFVKTETMETLAVETRQQLGTCYWMAPETLKIGAKAKYTRKSDIYSAGILFWEIATREIPYAGTDPAIVVVEVQKGERPEMPDPEQTGTPKKFAALIQACWAQKTLNRPEAKAVIERLDVCAKQLGMNKGK